MMTDAMEKWCAPKVTEIKDVMEAVKFPANNNQLGVAAFALWKILQ